MLNRFMMNGKGISLSPNVLTKIWIPDLHIHNLSSIKFHDDWYSMTGARIMTSEETNQIDSDKRRMNTGIELRYDIKASVYCPFVYDYYPHGYTNMQDWYWKSLLGYTFQTV